MCEHAYIHTYIHEYNERLFNGLHAQTESVEALLSVCGDMQFAAFLLLPLSPHSSETQKPFPVSVRRLWSLWLPCLPGVTTDWSVPDLDFSDSHRKNHFPLVLDIRPKASGDWSTAVQKAEKLLCIAPV